MDSLREKVSRAILRAGGSDITNDDAVADYHLPAADAAIAAVLDAMREPTKEMVGAAEKLWWLDWDNDEEVYITVTDVQAQQVWRAMLEAFLQEQSAPSDGE